MRWTLTIAAAVLWIWLGAWWALERIVPFMSGHAGLSGTPGTATVSTWRTFWGESATSIECAATFVEAGGTGASQIALVTEDNAFRPGERVAVRKIGREAYPHSLRVAFGGALNLIFFVGLWLAPVAGMFFFQKSLGSWVEDYITRIAYAVIVVLGALVMIFMVLRVAFIAVD